MSTTLKTAATVGSKISSVVVVAVTVRQDGAVFADWQGLDDKGQGVLRQVAAFSPESAKDLLAGPVSELASKSEAAIVSAIANGEAPPKDLASSPVAPAVPEAFLAARNARLAALAKAREAVQRADGSLPPQQTGGPKP